jgi:hypothetical protein
MSASATLDPPATPEELSAFFQTSEAYCLAPERSRYDPWLSTSTLKDQ